MKLYQAGYFRKGKQGNNAGWNIVSPSEGMSKIAKDGFQGLAANLTELKKKGAMPVTNMGLFLYDRFVYLLHVNYAASGEDARGVTYVHGYCFNLSDYYELCADPSYLFSISDENFELEYDEAVKAYPVKDGFTVGEPLDFDALMEKYHFSAEDYRNLMLGALCAIDGSGDSLCIKCDVPIEEYKQAYRELLYLIMMGLPYHLRLRVSCFSYKGARAAVYLSNEAEGNNYVDLDAHTFVCDTSKMGLYHFTRLYNMQLSQRAVREKIFDTIADFENKAFENPLKETGCIQTEAGYQAKIKRNQAGGIAPEAAVELLQGFMMNALADSEETASYLTELLRLINDNEYEIRDNKTINRIRKFYEKTTDEQYKQEVDRYFAAAIVRQGKKGYQTLKELQESEEQFWRVCNMVRSRDEAYYTQYFEQEYLPGILTGLDQVDTFMATEYGEFMTAKGYQAALSIFEKLMLSEIEAAGSFEELMQAERRASGLLIRFTELVPQEGALVLGTVYKQLWEQFDLTWFDPEKEADYKACKIEIMARKSKKAGAVCDMMRLVNSNFEENKGFLADLLLTGEILREKKEKEALQKILRREFRKAGNWRDTDNFDVFLCLYYNYGAKQFDTLSWCKDCYKKKCEASVFSPVKVQERIETSLILRDADWKERLAESLETDIHDAKKENFTKEQIKGLKLYYNCLMGKDIEPGRKGPSKDHFVDSIHRIFIGFCALIAIGTGCYCVHTYEGDTMLGKASAIALIVFLVLWLGLFLAKVILSGGIGDAMEQAGITTDETAKPVAYFGMMGAGLLACVAIFFLSRLLDSSGQFIFRMIGAGIFVVLAAISTAVYFIKAEE